MNPLVVDTSVAFKWFHPFGEDSVGVATEILDAHEAGSLLICAPASLHFELANSLRFSRLEPGDVMELAGKLHEYRVELAKATPSRLAEAVRLSYHHRISVYDSLFLQLAEELACPLVTADRRAFAGIDTPIEIRLL